MSRETKRNVEGGKKHSSNFPLTGSEAADRIRSRCGSAPCDRGAGAPAEGLDGTRAPVGERERRGRGGSEGLTGVCGRRVTHCTCHPIPSSRPAGRDAESLPANQEEEPRHVVRYVSLDIYVRSVPLFVRMRMRRY